ncbi:MAG: hypothetical protein JW741_29465 [Sedimentisphaerales bacterium]|nr:hypothetical protein [Sedimentisphaerales bacterium]
MKANKPQSTCPLSFSRRHFLAGAGAIGTASQMGLFNFTSSLFAGQGAAGPKPIVRVAFVRPDTDKYWLGWPGAAYDIKGHQRLYTKTLKEAAAKHGVDLVVVDAPLHNEDAVTKFLNSLKRMPPAGLFVMSMSLNQSWPHINRIAKERGEIPTVVFSPMGTSFTGHLQATRNIPGVYVAATQDVGWLDFGMRMIRTIWDMKHTRICICAGNKTEDRPLDVIGTTLRYIPSSRFVEEHKKVDATDEVRAMADYYAKHAKKIVEPTKTDILEAAKNYVVCRRLMKAENCQGFSMDCLGPVGGHKMQPPCMAFSRLRDEGGLGTCEADWNAAISTRLTNLLFDRPGFMQDPAPNTVNNTLMAAHCCCGTKLAGFDKDPEPFILRSHSESDIGVAVQVLWEIGRPVTIMKFQGPESIILGTGKIVRNIDTPPSGGCRTSVELTVDGVADSRDVKGFHQLLIYDDLELPFKAYCQLAGIKVVHV